MGEEKGGGGEVKSANRPITLGLKRNGNVSLLSDHRHSNGIADWCVRTRDEGGHAGVISRGGLSAPAARGHS